MTVRRPAPGADLHFESLSKDQSSRHEELVDLFGRYVMWLRNWSTSSAKMLIESVEAREKIGKIFRQPYEEAAQLSDEDRGRAMRLADSTVDGFIELLIRVLAHQGDDFQLGNGHNIRYKLLMEIVDSQSGEVVHEEIVNRNGQKHFADYWGRWLNKFGDK